MKVSKSNDYQVADQVIENLFLTSRKQIGISTEEISRIAEIDHGIILQIESVPHLVSLHDLYAVANCLNLDPGSVLEFLHNSVFHGGEK